MDEELKIKTTFKSSIVGKLQKTWPKVEGDFEEPVYLCHCSNLNMEDTLKVNMLEAYGVPAIIHYPNDGSFGKVILGMSGDGSDLYVPKSMYEDAINLINAENVEELND